MIDWKKVLDNAVAAAQQVIGANWQPVANAAKFQIVALIENGKFIEENKDSMSDVEFKAAKLNQQRALEGVLKGFDAISIVVAEEAAAAAWRVVETALKSIPQLAPFIVV
jgi:hypothetical protein